MSLLSQIKVVQSGLKFPLKIFINETSHVEHVNMFCVNELDAEFVVIGEFAAVSIEILEDGSAAGDSEAQTLRGYSIGSSAQSEGLISAVNRTIEICHASSAHLQKVPKIVQLRQEQSEQNTETSKALENELFLVRMNPKRGAKSQNLGFKLPRAYYQKFENCQVKSEKRVFKMKSQNVLNPVQIEKDPRILKIENSEIISFRLKITIISNLRPHEFKRIFSKCSKQFKDEKPESEVLLQINEFVYHPLLKCELKLTPLFKSSALDLKNPLHEQEQRAVQFLLFESLQVFKKTIKKANFIFQASLPEASASDLRLYKPELHVFQTEQAQRAVRYSTGAKGRCFGLEVNGISGSGKSFLVRTITSSLAWPVFEIDLNHLLYSKKSIKFADFLLDVNTRK